MKIQKITIILILAILPLVSGCVSTDVNPEEKAYLITIDDLAAQGVTVGTPSQAGVKYVARRFINGTTEVEYEYDAEKDSGNSAIILFYSEADTLRNETLAIKAFSDAIEAYNLGATLGNNDIAVVEIPGAFSLGEQNYTAVLETKEIPFGNLVVTRKGALVYSFLLAGPHINSRQTLNNLIGPKLAYFEE